jgi:pimeloyl-ACP methyl ester carboxylesterase
MKFVKANGLVIHYLDRGQRDGAPIVFINALGCDLRIWTEIAEILAPDFRVITYDKRGNPAPTRARWPTMRATSWAFRTVSAPGGLRSSDFLSAA